ncbi:hypothetical protein NYO12_10150 [Klebsiella variicola]|uniref:hypothetical protein n=1 Tax=Klebsiella variicola TaxID=244366 RepID=UPI0021672C4D|nr:hypothetical protein [Klebsiella variicola]UVW54680.1 hypothetical protein NYO12_10150 [Klebsiella variicola]
MNDIKKKISQSGVDYLVDRWLDVGLPEALKVATKLAMDGEDEDRIIAGAVSVMKAAVKATLTVVSCDRLEADPSEGD